MLGAPERFQGNRIRVRGLPILILERMALAEPKRGGRSIGLDIHRIRPGTEEALRACDGKTVYVEGYLTHAPTRRGEEWFIMAEAMSSRALAHDGPADARDLKLGD
jgi:hypothetical protein